MPQPISSSRGASACEPPSVPAIPTVGIILVVRIYDVSAGFILIVRGYRLDMYQTLGSLGQSETVQLPDCLVREVHVIPPILVQ